MLTVQQKGKPGIATSAITFIATAIASAAMYMLIVKYFMVKIMHVNIDNDGGYRVTFIEVLGINLIVLFLGYLLFLLLQWILRIKSLSVKILLAGVCMPATWIGLLYTAWGADWQSPITYVYLGLLFVSGLLIVYLSYFVARRMRTTK